MTNQPNKNHTSKAPFSIKFSLFMALLASFVLPVLLLSPLLIIHLLGFPLSRVGVTTSSFGEFVLVVQAAALVISLVIIAKKLKKQHKTWTSIGLRKFKTFQGVRYILGYFLILFGLMLALAIVMSALGVNAPESSDSQGRGSIVLNLMGSFGLAFVAAVVLGPIIEEIIFRGILFPALRQRYGVWIGVIGSSLVFMLAHLDPVTMISALPLGAYLAVMYHKTNSIYPGMILHATWNLGVLLIVNI